MAGGRAEKRLADEISASPGGTDAEGTARISEPTQEREAFDLNSPLFPDLSTDFDLNLALMPNSLRESATGGAAMPSGSRFDPGGVEVIDLVSDESDGGAEPMVLDQKRYIYEEKGKGKLVLDPELEFNMDSIWMLLDLEGDRRVGDEDRMVIGDDWLSMSVPDVGLNQEVRVEDEGMGMEEIPQRGDGLAFGDDRYFDYYYAQDPLERKRRDNLELAVKLAPKFAVYKKGIDDDGNDDEEEMAQILLQIAQPEDISGPFLDAKKIVEVREAKVRWTPSRNQGFRPSERSPPSLKELCLRVLVEYAEEIESLEGVPDALKQTFVSLLISKRKMNFHVLGLYLAGSPVEIHLTDCSWVSEEQFEKILAEFNKDQLKVLQLDLCGRCVTDYVLRATLAKSPNSLALLRTVSLKGACRLSDDGLGALTSAAPLLSSINLGQCSLLTSDGIISLSAKLNSVLRELYLDDCQHVDAMIILPALKKIRFLEVLSVARLQNVCDQFVYDLVCVCGPNLKELVFADCQKLTDVSVKAIGKNCPHLCALDIQNLNLLHDSAIAWLANGCRSIQKLKLRRNAFSDIAIAAFLEASGGSLTELSLNNVREVADRTALAISLRCSLRLQSLDLSFCRMMTDEALGLIVDSCSNLRFLKLFGCTQIKEFFLNGHSNPLVKIIGLEGSILDQMKMPDFLKKLDPLEAYVPAVLLTQAQFKDLEKYLDLEQPKYDVSRSLLRSGPAASLRINIRAVAQYATDDGKGKAASDAVDQCLRALEDLDSLLLHASRNDPTASIVSMKSKITIALGALDGLLQTVPSAVLDKGKAIADAYRNPNDEESKPEDLDPDLKQLEALL